MSSLHTTTTDDQSSERGLPAPRVPTEIEIARAVAAGQRLRAEVLRGGIRRLGLVLLAPFRRSRPVERPDEPVANALAAIRSAAEVIRDTPDLDVRDRKRFADMVLSEEARLETLLGKWRNSGMSTA